MASQAPSVCRSLGAVVAQIMVVDIVFSLDSVITAVGMVSDVSLMITANVIALAIMLAAAGPIGAFVDRHPTVKMLALSFLVLIGTNLMAEGFGVHVPKAYTYFAMGFAVMVEMLNLKLRNNAARYSPRCAVICSTVHRPEPVTTMIGSSGSQATDSSAPAFASALFEAIAYRSTPASGECRSLAA